MIIGDLTSEENTGCDWKCPLTHQCHDPHALHVAGGAPGVELRGGVSAGRRGRGQGGGSGRGSDGGSVVVHSGQVEPLQADAGYSVLDLLRPQLRGLLLLLYEPGGRKRRGELEKS